MLQIRHVHHIVLLLSANYQTTVEEDARIASGQSLSE